ncbi:MAG: hypothetical protein HY878_04900 [Deltaproteobacteria bacterium]|nr:hypothetical protein [Deltaproteobacteria bacterium]
MGQPNKGIYDHIEILYRRKWMLITPVLLGTVIATFIAYTSPPYYRSTTLILVERQQVPEAYVTPTDRTPIQERLSTIRQQVMSWTKLEQIIKDFNLYKDEEKQGAPNIFLKAIRGFGLGIPTTPGKEEVVEQMKQDIDIKVIGGTVGKGGDAFSIDYTGRDPYITMQVTNTLASLFIEENLKRREDYAEGTSEFITNELEKAKQGLEEQEKNLKTFKERYMGGLPEQLETNLRTLDRLQLELQSVDSSLKNAEDRRAFLEEQLGLATSPSTGPVRSPVAAPLEIELARLKNELASLLSVYKESYPDVIMTRNRIKEIEEMLAAKKADVQRPDEQARLEPGDRRAAVNADLMTVRSQIETLKRREPEVRRQIKILERRVEDTPANEQRLTDIARDYQISLKNYQGLLEKRLNARLAENLERRQKGERFRVIDPANLPERPYKPDKLKIIILGVMAGGGIGVGLVFLFELLNPAFRRPEDFAGVITQPILAVIPLFSKKSRSIPVKKFEVVKGKRGDIL